MGPVVAARVTMRWPDFATLIVAATILLPQAIVAVISPWIGRRADRSGRRPLLLLGWGLLPVQGLLYAALPGPFALVLGNLLNAVSGAIFGVTMTVVAADLTRRTGCFNLTLGALGVAIAVGASLSTFFTGISVAVFGVGEQSSAWLWLGYVDCCCCGRVCRRHVRDKFRSAYPALEGCEALCVTRAIGYFTRCATRQVQVGQGFPHQGSCRPCRPRPSPEARRAVPTIAAVSGEPGPTAHCYKPRPSALCPEPPSAAVIGAVPAGAPSSDDHRARHRLVR